MKQRDCDGVRESIEDDFVDDVAPRANCIPAHTQQNYPEPFPDRGPVRRSHLPVRSDELPVCVCLSASGEGSTAHTQSYHKENAQLPATHFKIKATHIYKFLKFLQNAVFLFVCFSNEDFANSFPLWFRNGNVSFSDVYTCCTALLEFIYHIKVITKSQRHSHKKRQSQLIKFFINTYQHVH